MKSGKHQNDWHLIDEWSFEAPYFGKTYVKPFKVSARPVSMKEFQNFVETTGYSTTAEQQKSSATFRSNPGLLEMEKRGLSVLDSTPSYLSFEDARNYCIFAKQALMNEMQFYSIALRSPPKEWEDSSTFEYKGPFLQLDDLDSMFCWSTDLKPLFLHTPPRTLKEWEVEYASIRITADPEVPVPFSTFRTIILP